MALTWLQPTSQHARRDRPPPPCGTGCGCGDRVPESGEVNSAKPLCFEKPMRHPTRMRTIVRVNPVMPGRTIGLVWDCVGVFGELQKAPAIDAQGSRPGKLPIQDPSALLGERRDVRKATEDLWPAQASDLESLIRARVRAD